MRLAVIRVHPEGRTKAVLRLVEAIESAQRFAQVVVRAHGAGLKPKRVLEHLHRLLLVARLMCQRAEKMPGIGEIRRQRDSAAIEGFRACEIAGAMKLQAMLK